MGNPTKLTMRQCVYDVMEFYRGQLKDTDSVPYRQIRFWIETLRAKLLREQFNKYQDITEGNLVQYYDPVTLPNQITGVLSGTLDHGYGLPLYPIPNQSIAGSGSTFSQQSIYWTFTNTGLTSGTVPNQNNSGGYPGSISPPSLGDLGVIPQTIAREGMTSSMLRVSVVNYDPTGVLSNLNADNTESYPIWPYEQFLVMGNGKFDASETFVSIRNNIIYVKGPSVIGVGNTKGDGSPSKLTRVFLRGVFENPTFVETINTIGGSADIAYNDDSAYPINASLLDQIKQIIVSKEFKITFVKPTDTKDNEANDVTLNTMGKQQPQQQQQQ